jgi:hypothetical protein
MKVGIKKKYKKGSNRQPHKCMIKILDHKEDTTKGKYNLISHNIFDYIKTSFHAKT